MLRIIKGLVELSRSFWYLLFLTIIHTIQQMYIHNLSFTIRRGLSSCILVIASSLSKRRTSMGALPIELRRTPEDRGLWHRLFDADFAALFLTAIFFLFCLRRDFFPGRPEPSVESAGQRWRAGGWDTLQTEVASDPDPDPGFLSSNWNTIFFITSFPFFFILMNWFNDWLTGGLIVYGSIDGLMIVWRRNISRIHSSLRR